MNSMRSLAVLLSTVLVAGALAACSSHTERTVYVPAAEPAPPPATTVVVPAPTYTRY